MKFAVIRTGGKQYKVAEGASVSIEKLSGDHKIGDTVAFSDVLLKVDGESFDIGMPTLAGQTVKGEIEAIGRAPKIDVIKYKQKSRYFKKNGHRQPFFKVKIKSI